MEKGADDDIIQGSSLGRMPVRDIGVLTVSTWDYKSPGEASSDVKPSEVVSASKSHHVAVNLMEDVFLRCFRGKQNASNCM